MHRKTILQYFLLFAMLLVVLRPATSAQALGGQRRGLNLPIRADGVTAYDLIIAMNTLRASNGLQPLIEDPIVNAVAQSTAEIMAANQMSWHIGDVSGRLTSAGYGGGAKVWATENFAVGGSHSIDTIMVVWSDAAHMIPAVQPAYCHVGAGVAESSNGMTYYVLQAAYTSGKSCGPYNLPDGATRDPKSTPGTVSAISQLIVPVKIATPDADGKIFHVVQSGQSFWSIAVAYKITIKDLEIWNNLSKDSKLQIGQKLFIPGENTKGYATPTPVGMIEISKPDKEGKIIHSVQSYQTLTGIAQAYNTKLETILALNGIQEDWPLQIGQKLIIQSGSVTPSATARPLTPVEKLTPASDGKYYHTVGPGETLSWIADLYKIQLNELMAWNSLNSASILHPNEKLVLQVTPPATITPTPAPATNTPVPTIAPPTASPTATTSTVTQGSPTPAATVIASTTEERTATIVWSALIGLGALGLFLVIFFGRKR